MKTKLKRKSKKSEIYSNLESMTGFGEASLKSDSRSDLKYYCKIKSVNNRYLDVKVRIPRSDLYELENKTKKLIQNCFKRGTFEISYGIEKADLKQASDNEIIDYGWLAKLGNSIKKNKKIIEKNGFLTSGIHFSNLISLDQLYLSKRSEPQKDQYDSMDPAELIKYWHLALEQSISVIKSDRKREGNVLAVHLLNIISKIKFDFSEIKKLEPVEKQAAMAQYQQRIIKTLELINIKNDEGSPMLKSMDFEKRLKEEAVFWIERRDFEEELIRFQAHLDHFEKAITEYSGNDESSLGKLLEFKHQELQREINTLGNKAQNVSISKHVVSIKTLIEKIKEQIANVE